MPTSVQRVLRHNDNDTIVYITAACESLHNQQPHFSVTVSGPNFGGCCHDVVLRLRPDLKPVVDLHLSTEDGVPMHAVENAVHWVSGILTDLPGFRYRPNSGMHDHGRQTPAWCTERLKEHLRMDPAPLLVRVREAVDPWLATYCEYEADAAHIESVVRTVVTQVVEEEKPRWQREAERALAVIHKLPEEM